MSAASTCPGVESWQALLDEALPAEEQRRQERHLEACPACQQRLHHAAPCADALRRVGREVGDPTVTPGDPTLAQVLAQLHQARRPDAVAAPVDLYFLQPAD